MILFNWCTCADVGHVLVVEQSGRRNVKLDSPVNVRCDRSARPVRCVSEEHSSDVVE
jgi:hypothetical protein